MTNARIVLTTVGLKEAADRLAQQLVEQRLAACVNIVGPVRSVYRWRDKVENEAEYLVLAKTTAEAAAHLRLALKTLTLRVAGVRGNCDKRRKRRISCVGSGRGEQRRIVFTTRRCSSSSPRNASAVPPGRESQWSRRPSSRVRRLAAGTPQFESAGFAISKSSPKHCTRRR